ncbi:MerR family transcriptional regulator [Gordonia sp. NPDC058843]|uniref:DNA polymerase III subunit beta family protein n=1 Tax=Gordonia sp. NPDC058843 TaxID=3346648 RepID=UPI0036A97D96
MISDVPPPDTEPDQLVPIGAFAQRTGLTASALRFYADSGLLDPASVDASTGYRLYSASQEPHAITLRRLREIGMSLADIRVVLDAEPSTAGNLIDDHVRHVATEADRTRREATAIKLSIAADSTTALTSVRGPILAAAIGQVLTATARDAAHPVLDGVEFRLEDGTLTLTSTDRYRLSSRSLPTLEPSDTRWSGTLCAGDLRGGLSDLARGGVIGVEAGTTTVRFALDGRDDLWCRLLDGPFPSHDAMVDALPPVIMRASVAKSAVLQSLEHCVTERVHLDFTSTALALSDASSTAVGVVPADACGPQVALWFEVATLYPAISVSIGAELLLDVRAADLPMTIRSADGGDLTTFVMPAARPPAHIDRPPRREPVT